MTVHEFLRWQQSVNGHTCRIYGHRFTRVPQGVRSDTTADDPQRCTHCGWVVGTDGLPLTIHRPKEVMDAPQ